MPFRVRRLPPVFCEKVHVSYAIGRYRDELLLAGAWYENQVDIGPAFWCGDEGGKLELLPGFTRGIARGASFNGTIVGNCAGHVIDGDVEAACIWRLPDAEPAELPPLDGYDCSVAYSVNQAGDAIGLCYRRHQPRSRRGCLWRNGAPERFAAPRGSGTLVRAINRHGQVCGEITGSSHVARAACWLRGAFAEVDLPEDRPSITGHIDDDGHVIGIQAFPGKRDDVWLAKVGADGLRRARIICHRAPYHAEAPRIARFGSRLRVWSSIRSGESTVDDLEADHVLTGVVPVYDELPASTEEDVLVLRPPDVESDGRAEISAVCAASGRFAVGLARFDDGENGCLIEELL